MFRPRDEINLINYNLQNNFVGANSVQTFKQKIYEGQVIGFINDSGYWALQVRQYAPMSISASNTLIFDDASRIQTQGSITPYIKVSVVNCFTSEKIKALYSVGDKITFFNTRWASNITNNYPSNWITISPTEEFW